MFASLILLQSIAVVADAHPFDSANDGHITEAHQHDDNSVDDLDHSIDSDCGHCCHCHSAPGSAVLPLHSSLALLKQTTTFNMIYEFGFVPEPLYSLYRPPIV